jgi:V/A-type H+-transporting ATPase subunit D
VGKLKLTKTELRSEQNRFKQLEKYLPTLQLKKAMLQAEVNEARIEIQECEELYERQKKVVDSFALLMSEITLSDVYLASRVDKVGRRYENIAGVEVPYFEGISFHPFEYDLFSTEASMDGMVINLRKLLEANVRIEIAEEKKQALENELRSVSIRVNLFEKVLIPRASQNIKKIKVFLADQELAAVSRAKVAKEKILLRKKGY